MPSNTTLGYPYPLSSEPVADGDNAIQNLAQAVDDKAGVFASGVESVTFGANGTPVAIPVTFPVGRFTTAPVVQIALRGVASPQAYAVSTGTPTSSGVTLYVTRITGSSGASLQWLAHQQ